MGETSDNQINGNQSNEKNAILLNRLRRLNVAVVILAVAGSLFFWNWQISGGVALGGMLSLLNFYWLKTSTGAMLAESAEGGKPSLIVRFFLRYLVIGAVIVISYLSNLVSVVALLSGLLAFTVAVFAESFYQIYLTIVKREDI